MADRKVSYRELGLAFSLITLVYLIVSSSFLSYNLGRGVSHENYYYESNAQPFVILLYIF